LGLIFKFWESFRRKKSGKIGDCDSVIIAEQIIITLFFQENRLFIAEKYHILAKNLVISHRKK
jgi:hypothetical protein